MSKILAAVNPRFLTGLSDCRVVGAKTREEATLAARCEELAATGIAVTGESETRWPYRMVRNHTKRDHVVVCTGGWGEVWQGGEWRRCEPGMMYLAPRGAAHAYRAVRGVAWRHVWVIYQPGFSIAMPVGAECRACRESHEPLVQALRGMKLEVEHGRNLAQRRLWAGLVSAYWSQMISADAPRRRLDPLWREVDTNLAYPWTIVTMARRAGVSDEHLRRLALSEVGRSPLRQVTWLRLTRAAALLQTTQLKLEAIAELVGYGDGFSLSAAYRRHFGEAPSACRGRGDRLGRGRGEGRSEGGSF